MGTTICILGSLLYMKTFLFYAISNQFDNNSKEYSCRKSKLGKVIRLENMRMAIRKSKAA